jgi:hypothetical protein
MALLALPSRTLRTQLLDLGETWVWDRSYDGGGSDGEYLEDRRWIWDSASGLEVLKLGNAALAAIMWRCTGNPTYRRYAMESIDYYFETYQDSATGGIHHHGSVDVASETEFNVAQGGPNLALAVCALGEHRRWYRRWERAIAYYDSRGSDDWYTNGNIVLGGVVAKWLLARMSGFNSTHVAGYERMMKFLFDPPAVEPGFWAGWGWRAQQAPTDLIWWTDAEGYFSEVNGGGDPGTDVSAANVLDEEYTMLQVGFALAGFFTSGDLRFQQMLHGMANMFDGIRNNTTNFISATASSRHSGTDYTFRFLPPLYPTLVWMLGRTDLADRVTTNLTVEGSAEDGMIDWYYARIDEGTSINFYRGVGFEVGSAILAAHGLIL